MLTCEIHFRRAALLITAATSQRRPMARLVPGRFVPSDRPRRARACRGARRPCPDRPLAISLGIPLGIRAAAALRGARSAVGARSSVPIRTLAPSDRLAKPVVTTRSDVVRPLAITASFSFCCVTTTGFAVAILSWADHVAERSGRAALHRRRRHHDRLLERFDLQPHIDELSGPELELGVRKFGLQLQRARGRIDLVVDALQRAGIDDGDAVIAEHVHRQRALGRRRR